MALCGKNHPFFGKKRPDEVREKISLANAGKKRSKETRKKISLARLNKRNPNRKIFGKKYKVNEDIFSKIDTAEKAYWLGFIAADGNVRTNPYPNEKLIKKPGNYMLRIKLKYADKNHLEKFRRFLGSDVPIKGHWDTTAYGRHKFATIIIGRKKIVEDLGNWGIIENKTFQLNFPNIFKKYYSDFIRGYFDGDGSLYSSSGKGKKQLKFEICSGTKSFLEKLQQILISKLKLNKTKLMKRMGTNYRFSYGGNVQVLKIFNYLLQNSSVKLERKYKLLEN